MGCHGGMPKGDYDGELNGTQLESGRTRFSGGILAVNAVGQSGGLVVASNEMIFFSGLTVRAAHSSIEAKGAE